MVFVKVCGGTSRWGQRMIQMPTPTEKPSHPVKLSDYWIGKYEVSNAQYRKKEHGAQEHVRWG
jgi:formylglycine-generating enzyme required for sulfatase activity